MLIGLDIDGVVADFNSAVYRWVARNYGYDPPANETWNFFEEWPDGKMVRRAFWSRGIHRDRVLLECPLVLGAKEGVNRLLEWHDVAFVTHRKVDTLDQTMNWLHMHGWRQVPVYCMEDKSWLAADLFIDDKPETVRDLRGANRKALLYNQPWNFSAHDLHHVRCYNWPHVIKRVEAVEERGGV